MKKLLCTVLAVILVLLNNVQYADAVNDTMPPLRKVRMTSYTHTGNPCRNGKYPRVGVCAYQYKYLGYGVIVYEDNDGKPGDIIGYYEVYDTGYGFPTAIENKETGKPYGSLEIGSSIDVFQDTEEDCYEFAAEYGDTAFIQLIEAKG